MIEPAIMNTMESQVTEKVPMHVIRIGPNFDAQAEHNLESAVYQVQEARGKHVLLDLEALKTIDSRGLGKLFLAYHHLNRNQIRLGLVNPTPAVKEMLDFVNFSQVVKIFESVDKALELEGHALTSARQEPVQVLEG